MLNIVKTLTLHHTISHNDVTFPEATTVRPAVTSRQTRVEVGLVVSQRVIVAPEMCNYVLKTYYAEKDTKLIHLKIRLEMLVMLLNILSHET